MIIDWLLNCVAVFLLCIFCTGILIPQILLIAFRRQLFDEPDERKIHRSLVPRLGGIAFNPVILFSVLFVVGVNVALGKSALIMTSLGDAGPLLFGFCAMLVLYLVGIADDLIGVRYRAKFVIQVLCAVMLVFGGIWIDDFHGILWLGDIPAWSGKPFTVVVMVFIINAVNLIDGIDGLASGLSAIASLIYGVTFLILGDYMYAMLSVATMGVLIPFFYFNVFGNAEKRRKIFMGDTGSLTIGIILSLLSIRISMYPSDECIAHANPMVIAFTPLFVPCFDVVRVYMRRIRNGKNPFLPDKTHIHHKLLAIGLHQRTAMVTLVTGNLLLVVANILLSRYLDVNLLLVLDTLLWIAVNMWLSREARRRRQ